MKAVNKNNPISRVNSVDEASAIRKMSFASVFGNAVLSAFKLFAGVAGNSGAMISDAIHSFSDVITTVIAWIGVKASKKEADTAHPYGHDRIECIASLGLGIILLATGLGVGKTGVETILSGSYESLAAPGAIALAAAIVSIVSKEAMYWYTRYYANLINSSAFMADAWHHRCIFIGWFSDRHWRSNAWIPCDGLCGQCGDLPVHCEGILRYFEGWHRQTAGHLLRGNL